MGLTNFNLVTTYQRDYSGVRTARPLTAAPASYRMASADKSAAERPVTRGGPEVNDWVVNARLYIQNNMVPLMMELLDIILYQQHRKQSYPKCYNI